MRHSSIIILPVALFQLFITTGNCSAVQNVSVAEEGNTLKNVCLDNDGRERKVGESWKENCNICRCAHGGVKGCTRSSCLQGDVYEMSKESLFKTTQKKRVIAKFLLLTLK